MTATAVTVGVDGADGTTATDDGVVDCESHAIIAPCGPYGSGQSHVLDLQAAAIRGRFFPRSVNRPASLTRCDRQRSRTRKRLFRRYRRFQGEQLSDD